MPKVSCATLETVMNLAALNSTYQGHEHIYKDDVTDALLQVVYRLSKTDKSLDLTECQKIALHEAAHAVVGEILNPDSIGIVTIRGNQSCIGGFENGCSTYLKNEEELLNDITKTLAGKAGVSLIYGVMDVNASVKLCSRATLSNCQFIDCAGKDLVTSRWNSQVTIQDCEFSNISLSPVNSVEEIEQIGELCLKNYIRELIPGKFSTLDTKGVLIEIGGVDKKFANSNRPSKIERCIFNGVHICSEGGFACNMGKWKACKADRNLTKDQMNFLISVYTANYDKFNYPRVIVSDCTFKNCASVHQEIINTEPYDSVFGSRHNYTAISVRNNYGLDNIGDPTSYVKSSDVKLKEIDANGNKIGSSLSVN